MVTQFDHGDRGFTLVELMVTIALVAILALIAAPFGRQWGDSNRQMQLRSQLLEGVAHARALALRNAYNATGGDAGDPVETVRLVLDDASGALQLVQKTASGWPAAGTAPVWQGLPLHPQTRLTLSGDTSLDMTFDCVGYDSRGRLVDAGACAPGGDRHRVAIHAGDLDTIHVDLL